MSAGHWDRMSAYWRHVGPPLRPSAADLAIYQRVVDDATASVVPPLRALVLGVTPELYGLGWPQDVRLRALDGSARMIAAVWPGASGTALTGSWTAMPFADATFDLLLCDGGFGLLDHPAGQARLLDEAHRVLAPGGLFAVRLFAPQGRTGTMADILSDLDRGVIASLDALKLRLWGALQRNVVDGVRPREVVACILDACGAWDRLAQRQGWPVEHVRALELHRASDACYHLIDAEDLVRMACAEADGFIAAGTHRPAQAFGDCCPIVVLRRGENIR